MHQPLHQPLPQPAPALHQPVLDLDHVQPYLPPGAVLYIMAGNRPHLDGVVSQATADKGRAAHDACRPRGVSVPKTG